MPDLSEPQRSALLEAAGLHPQKLGWLPDGTAVLSRHRRRWAARIDLDGAAGTVGVYVKWWAAPTWGELFSGKGWFCPAKDEAKRCRRLRAAGINAPQVLQVQRAGGIVIPGGSRLVLAEVAGAPLMDSWPDEPSARRSLAMKLGALVRGVAAAGISMPDLHCKHVLVAGLQGEWELGVVDCARAGDPTGEHQELAALDASRPAGASRADRLRVLRAATGKTGAELKVLAKTVRARAAGLAAVFRTRAIGATLPAEVSLDGGRMRATEDSLPILLAHAFETGHAFADAARGTLIRSRNGYENLEYSLGLPGPKAHWYAKRYHTKPWSAVWRGVLGMAPTGDPAQREWEMLRRCLALGIRVPEPVALGLIGFERPSFVVVAEVGGARPLDELLREVPSGNRARRSKIAAALADLVQRFHAAGMTHRDLYLNHVLHGDGPAGPVLTLIDLARVERNAAWAAHRLVKDLAALEYSARPCTTRTERWRWFAQYWREGPMVMKTLAREVSAKADRIARHEAKVAARQNER